MCQLLELNNMAEPTPFIRKVWQYRIKMLKKMKKYFVVYRNKVLRFNPLFSRKGEGTQILHQDGMKAGDVVRVRSKEEILKTLDDQNKYKGCLLVSDMFRYCGGTYKVFKDVGYFYDEARFQVMKCKDTVILEGVLCSGDTSKAFKEKCDRSCFFFWKTAWLEKIH